MKTIFYKEREIPHSWYVIDAAGKPLGRVAATVAAMARGKHKVFYAPHQESGDYIIVINADKVVVTATPDSPAGLNRLILIRSLEKSPPNRCFLQ